MKKFVLQLSFLIIFSSIFFSCGYDELAPDYNNRNDPESVTYTPWPPYVYGINYYGSTTATCVTLRWESNSRYESGFIIERSDGANNNFVEVGRAAAGSTTYKDNGNFRIRVNYYYRVRAYKGNNVSKPSNVVVEFLW